MLIRMVKLYKAKNSSNKIRIKKVGDLKHIISLLKLFLYILSANHMVSCLYFGYGKL